MDANIIDKGQLSWILSCIIQVHWIYVLTVFHYEFISACYILNLIALDETINFDKANVYWWEGGGPNLLLLFSGFHCSTEKAILERIKE